MSIIITTPTKIATLSAATRKAFNAVPLESMIHGAIFRDGITNETAIRPSDIRMTSATALAALGGKMSPQSFLHGLVFTAARYAHGNMIDATSLPLGSLTAINATLALIKKGAGISALSLETAARAGIKALLELPAPMKKAPTIAAPKVDAPKADAPKADAPVLNLLSLKAGIARRSESAAHDADEEGYSNPHNASAQARADMRASDQAALVAVIAATRASEAAKFEKTAAESAVALVTSVTARRDAEQIAREIAQALGFKLVRIPAKKAA